MQPSFYAMLTLLYTITFICPFSLYTSVIEGHPIFGNRVCFQNVRLSSQEVIFSVCLCLLKKKIVYVKQLRFSRQGVFEIAIILVHKNELICSFNVQEIHYIGISYF